MKYKVFYVTDNGKRFFDRVEAYSENDAELKVRRKYNDIKEVIQVSEDY